MMRRFLRPGALTISLAVMFACGWSTFASAQETEPTTVVRELTIWYGTVTFGNSAPVSGIQSTRHVPQSLADQIQAAYGDNRVTGGIQDWVVSVTYDQDWMYGLVADEDLPAEQDLRDSFSASAAGCEGPLAYDRPFNRGTARYFITSWSMPEAEVMYDFDGYADVTFMELNARCPGAPPDLLDSGLPPQTAPTSAVTSQASSLPATGISLLLTVSVAVVLGAGSLQFIRRGHQGRGADADKS